MFAEINGIKEEPVTKEVDMKTDSQPCENHENDAEPSPIFNQREIKNDNSVYENFEDHLSSVIQYEEKDPFFEEKRLMIKIDRSECERLCKYYQTKLMSNAEHVEMINTYELEKSFSEWNYCKECELFLESDSKFDEHNAIHKKKPFTCVKCYLHFRTESKKKLHDLKHENPYKCSLCRKSFTNCEDLKDHVDSHANSYKCPICNKKFHVTSQLGQHILDDHMNEVKCKICYKTFETEYQLRIHVSHRHKNKTKNNGSSYSSLSWKKQFDKVANIARNVQRELTCKVCSKTFDSIYTLTIHKSFSSCTILNKVRKIDSKMHKHMCKQCKLSFVNKYDLYVHSSVHTSDPMYCKVCHVKYTVCLKLKKHLYKHYTKKFHCRCDICGKFLASARGFTVHMKMSHEKDFRKIKSKFL